MKTADWGLQTLRIVGGCALSYGITSVMGLPDGFWAPITALAITQPLLARTVAAGRQYALGTVLGALVGFLVLLGAQGGVPQMMLFWAALVVLGVLVARWPNLRLGIVTLMVVVLVPGSGSTVSRPVDRVLEILVGVLGAILVSVILKALRGWYSDADETPT